MAMIDSGPMTLDWSVYVGDSNEELFEFLTDGVPWDLTGAVVTAQARVTAPDPAIAVTATVAPVDPTIGTYHVSWDGEALRTLLAGAETWKGTWDLQVLEAGKTLPRTLLRGAFLATHDVTRTAA